MSPLSQRFRFSLRQIAALFVLIAILLAWYVFPVGAVPRKTGKEFDVAIFGQGWLRVVHPNGNVFYTRQGDLAVNRNGDITAGRDTNELIIEPPIAVPEAWSAIHITLDGQFWADVGDQNPRLALGQLLLTKFPNPEGLEEVFPGVYRATDDAGIPTLSAPGQGGTGMIKQGWIARDSSWFFLERSTLLLLIVLCVSIWTLFEVTKLHRRIEELKATNFNAPD